MDSYCFLPSPFSLLPSPFSLLPSPFSPLPANKDSLSRTANTQPALLGHSKAILRVLKDEMGVDLPSKSSYFLGHSAGEYSALHAAGSVSFSAALALLRKRGQLMQTAVPEGVGSMAALFPADTEKVRELCRAESHGDNHVCEVACENSNTQVVISGHTRAVEQVVKASKASKVARRATYLHVSAPFHCSLMAPAATNLAQYLKDITFHKLSSPLVSNVSATAVSDPHQIKELLAKQMTDPVLWYDSMKWISHQLGRRCTYVEIGPGGQLSRLAHSFTDSRIFSLNDVQSIEEFAKFCHLQSYEE